MNVKIFAAAIIGMTSAVHAQSPDMDSANAVMPGCIEVIESTQQAGFWGGYCLGIVRAMVNLSPTFNVCIPSGVTSGQSVRVVVQFINQNPARMHEGFQVLLMDAFRKNWPCPVK
jgi:hypothetical protein